MKKSITFFLNSNGNENEQVRAKTSNFLKSHSLSDKIVQEQIMIVKELLNICGQYTGIKSPQGKITVQIHISRDKITVEVSHPINGIQNKQLEKLDKTIQFIRGYQDPYEAFLKLKTLIKKSSFKYWIKKIAVRKAIRYIKNMKSFDFN